MDSQHLILAYIYIGHLFCDTINSYVWYYTIDFVMLGYMYHKIGYDLWHHKFKVLISQMANGTVDILGIDILEQ